MLIKRRRTKSFSSSQVQRGFGQQTHDIKSFPHIAQSPTPARRKAREQQKRLAGTVSSMRAMPITRVIMSLVSFPAVFGLMYSALERTTSTHKPTALRRANTDRQPAHPRNNAPKWKRKSFRKSSRPSYLPLPKRYTSIRLYVPTQNI